MTRETREAGDANWSRIKREASEWAVRQSYGFSAKEQDEFFDWLAKDPFHSEAYANAQKTWKHLDVLADWRPEHSLRPNPNLLDTATRRQKKRIVRFINFFGAVAAVIAISFGVWRYQAQTRPYQLAEGGYAKLYERHELKDGSVVELNRGAQAVVAYSHDRREITLERGEAYFTVEKDPEKPFIVIANGVAVQAVGTMFNVQIDGDAVDVIVTEGRVRVGPGSVDEPDLDASDIGKSIQELIAGQRTVIDPSEPTELTPVISISKEVIDEQLLWLNEVFDFTDTPLSEIVMEFNRRNKRKIVIEDKAIEDLAMSATIQPKNIESFVAILEVTMDIEVERIDDSVVVLRSRN